MLNYKQPISGGVAMLLWLAVSAQMVVWAWFSWRGGKLSDREFLFFTVGMVLGQLGAAVETYQTGAWRAFVVQLYFFVFTFFGGVQRFRRLRSIKRLKVLRSSPPGEAVLFAFVFNLAFYCF